MTAFDFLGKISEMYGDEKTGDVKLLITLGSPFSTYETRTFWMHSFLLCLHPYFKSALYGGFKETKTKTLNFTFETGSWKAVEYVLKFFYRKDVNKYEKFDLQTLFYIYQIFDRFGMDCPFSLDWLCRFFKPENIEWVAQNFGEESFTNEVFSRHFLWALSSAPFEIIIRILKGLSLHTIEAEVLSSKYLFFARNEERLELITRLSKEISLQVFSLQRYTILPLPPYISGESVRINRLKFPDDFTFTLSNPESVSEIYFDQDGNMPIKVEKYFIDDSGKLLICLPLGILSHTNDRRFVVFFA